MEEFLQEAQNLWIILLILAWTLPWKGVALWKAAKNSHKWWFVVILVINTFALLEIFYIFLVSKTKTESSQTRGKKVERE